MISAHNTNSIYEQFYRQIFRYTLKLSGDSNLAQAITADTFSAVSEKMLGGLKIQNVRSYLYQTAYHKIVDHSRQRHRFAPLEVAMIDPDQSVDIEILSEARGLQSWMKENLTERQYQVVTLRFLDGRTIEEVAEIANMTRGNVRATIHRARKVLMKYGMENAEAPNNKPKIDELKSNEPKKKYPSNSLIMEALNSKLTYGDRFDWQLTEQQFVTAYGYPETMSRAAEKFFRRYHQQLVKLAIEKGLVK